MSVLFILEYNLTIIYLSYFQHFHQFKIRTFYSVSGIDQLLDQTSEVLNFKQWIYCILTERIALAQQRRRDSSSVFQVLSYLLKKFFPLTQGILNK